MKIHIGTDVNSNAIHSATVTAANVADITELPNLLRVDDKVIFADAGYTSDSYKRGSRALGLSWKVKKNMSSTQKNQNRKNSGVRARVEHCFRVVKCQFGYKKVRYKSLEKNRVQVFSLLGLANLYMLRGQLVG
jgi:IS5 family transposase